MIPYDYAMFVLLTSFVLSAILLTVVFVWLCDKTNTDFDSFVLFVIIMVSAGCSVGITYVATGPAPTPIEMLEKELSKSNMSLDDMVFVNEGKIFKYNDHWYILTTDGKIIGLYQTDAERVLE